MFEDFRRSREIMYEAFGASEEERAQGRVRIAEDWESSFVAGLQVFNNRTSAVSGSSTNFPGPGIEVIGGGAVPQVFESFASIVNTGGFAQEQLGWHDWVFATVGGRYDYNSAFGKTSGGVFYPQASFSFVLSDRAGYKESFIGRHISTLRFRGAFGKAGRQPGAFDKLTTYAPLTAATERSDQRRRRATDQHTEQHADTAAPGFANDGFPHDRTLK